MLSQTDTACAPAQFGHAHQGVRSVRFAPHAFELLAQPFLHIPNFFASNANLTGHFTPHYRLQDFSPRGRITPSHGRPSARILLLLRHGRTMPRLTYYSLLWFSSLKRFAVFTQKRLMIAIHGIAHYLPKVANFALLMESKFFILCTYCSSTTRPKCQRTLCSVLNSGS